MNRTNMILVLVEFFNIIHVIYNSGVKPLFKATIAFIGVLYTEIVKPVSIYLYTKICELLAYLKEIDFQNKKEDIKKIFFNIVNYFKDNSSEIIYNDLVEIKNIIVVVIKHLYSRYEVGYKNVKIISLDTSFLIYDSSINGNVVTNKFSIEDGSIESIIIP